MTQTQNRPAPAPAAPAWAEPGRAVVAAVDTSRRSASAIGWAAAEARAHGRPLHLVHVSDPRTIPIPFHAGPDDPWGHQVLTAAETLVQRHWPGMEVHTELRYGDPADTLVACSAAQSALVVGRRGAGRFVRLLVGSTALTVAGRARVPVIVVPEGWEPDLHADDPVVLGVDHRDLQPDAVDFAFAEAQRRGVPLVAAHGRDVPGLDWDPEQEVHPVEAADASTVQQLEDALAPWRAAYPTVGVETVEGAGHPLTVLLDDAGPAQLIVTGRHSRRGRGDFPFGSVTRGVLHYADVPVAVVPPTS